MEIPLCGKIYDTAGNFCGELLGLQIETRERKLSHLLVQDIGRQPARLVPFTLLASAREDGLWLRCDESMMKTPETRKSFCNGRK